MNNNSDGFQTEDELICSFYQHIQEYITNKENIKYRFEVVAPGVIPDLVLFYEQKSQLSYVITVEFKLSNWRRAIKQAFRHRNFGNEAYVVIDESRSKSAIKNLDLFIQANVGLITFDLNKVIKTWHSPKPGLPFSKKYSKQVGFSLVSPEQSDIDGFTFINKLIANHEYYELKSIWESSVQVIN